MKSLSLKVLVNATNLVVGGSVQVVTSFIFEAIKADDKSVEWFFCVSALVAENLKRLGVEVECSERFAVFDRNPSHPIKGWKARGKLSKIEKKISPNIIFTVFGPFLKKFAGQHRGLPTAHLAGCAVCWSTHPNKIVYDKIGFKGRVIARLYKLWNFWCLRKADYYWIELDVAREGLKRGVGTDDAHIRTIKNTCAQVFLDAPKSVADFSQEEIRLLVMGNPYVHKNFDIIPSVLTELKKIDSARKYIFTLTAPEEGLAWQNIKAEADMRGVGEGVRSVGKVSLADCPSLYSDNHIVFLPTLLETFSATYPEAMAMQRPIVTTDLNFAHDICGNAAVYYSPLSANDAAKKIVQVVEDADLREKLLSAAKEVLAELPSPQQKYQLLVDYMKEIVQKEKNS